MALQPVTVQLFYSGVWNDHTISALVRDEIRITRGRADEASQPAPTTANVTLDGWRFNPRNPSSDLFGLIGRNTPLRILVGGVRRLVGEVSSWTPRQDPTGKDRWVEVVAADITRRLGQGSDPLRDTVHRFVRAAGSVALEYWPLSEKPPRTSGSSGLHARNTLNFTSQNVGALTPSRPNFGSGFLGDWLPVALETTSEGGDLSGGLLFGSIPPQPEQVCHTFAMDIMYRATPGPQTTDLPMNTEFYVFTANDVRWHWRTGVGSGNVEVAAYDTSSGTAVFIDGDTFAAAVLFDGNTHHVRLNVTDSVAGGATAADWSWLVDGQILGSGTFDVGVSNMGMPTRAEILYFGSGSEVAPVHLGHFVVWAAANSVDLDRFTPGATVAAAFGHAGEHAGRRFLRLASEESVLASIHGIEGIEDIDDTVPMGPQPLGTFEELLRECAAVDDGAMTGSLLLATTLLMFRGRARYNQAATLELDYAAEQVAPPLEPVVDDRLVRNDVTVTRRDGEEARAVDEDGPLGVDAIGRVTTDVPVNTLSAGHDLVSQAGWRLHVGTVDETRFPRVTVDLDASPGLVTAVNAIELSERITIANLPPELTPDLASLLVLGWTETVGSHRRVITFNCIPETPYHISEVEHADFGIIGADRGKTTVRTAFDVGTDTELQVQNNFGQFTGYWDDDEAPFDILVYGVRLTVVSFTGVTSDPDFSFLVNQTPVNGVVKTIPVGAAVDVFHKSYIGL